MYNLQHRTVSAVLKASKEAIKEKAGIARGRKAEGLQAIFACITLFLLSSIIHADCTIVDLYAGLF